MSDNSLLKSLMGMLGDNGLSSIAEKVGLDKEQAGTALQAAIPTILQALTSNSSTKSGAKSLNNALEKDHDGSLLDNLTSFLSNPEGANGTGILKHVMGSRRTSVENSISNQSGISAKSIGKILTIAAPLILAYLGKKKKEDNVSSGGLFDLLGGLTISSDNDSGFDLTDIISMFGGQKKSGGLLGGLLGSLFGR